MGNKPLVVAVAFLGLAAALVFSVASCSGCSGKPEEPKGGQPSQETPGKSPAPDEAKGGKSIDPATAGVLRGVVKFEGAPPPPAPITMTAECKALHSDSPAVESLVVNPNKTLRNVLVHVKKGLEGYQFSEASGDVVLDQKGCVYTPHVVALRTGQTLEIRSSDPTTHNVNALAFKKTTGFNKAMPMGSPSLRAKFKAQELSVPIRCDVHPWMGAVCHVLAHPFFAITGDSGEFEITGLPPGHYTIEAIHETLKPQTLEIDIAPKETKSAEFTFKG